MNSERFTLQMLDQQRLAVPAGFMLLPAACVAPQSQSPMEWLYQRMYDQAQRASETPRARELFKVMN